MDARITKQRLGNFLSYDWLKILVAIAAAVTGLLVLFTTVRTRPTTPQTYSVYGYTDLRAGDDSTTLGARMADSGTFSYDILSVEVESFSLDVYGANTAFTMRRMAGLGRVLFVSDHVEKKEDEEKKSEFENLLTYAIAERNGVETLTTYRDPVQYFTACENYLSLFYGENWREGTINEAQVRSSFFARNGGDKRFLFSSEKQEEGVRLEKQRLEKLRNDYLFVREQVDSGRLPIETYTTEKGTELTVGFAVGGLKDLKKLFYYDETEGDSVIASAEKVKLLLLDNGDTLGDLEYETFSFLRYLIEHYGA